MSAARPSFRRPAIPITGSARQRSLEFIPVAVVALVGAVAILLRAQQGPSSSVHVMLLSLVLVENVLALLACRRHPLAALLGVLATYALVDNEATTLLPVLVTLFTVVIGSERRIIGLAAAMSAALVIATPVIHVEMGSLFIHMLLPLLGLGLALAAGMIRRAGLRRAFPSAAAGSVVKRTLDG